MTQTKAKTVITRCHICDDVNVFDVPSDVYDAYNSPARRPIQEIWPSATPNQREQLITGSHVACSERLYAFMADIEDEA